MLDDARLGYWIGLLVATLSGFQFFWAKIHLWVYLVGKKRRRKDSLLI